MGKVSIATLVRNSPRRTTSRQSKTKPSSKQRTSAAFSSHAKKRFGNQSSEITAGTTATAKEAPTPVVRTPPLIYPKPDEKTMQQAAAFAAAVQMGLYYYQGMPSSAHSYYGQPLVSSQHIEEGTQSQLTTSELEYFHQQQQNHYHKYANEMGALGFSPPQPPPPILEPMPPHYQPHQHHSHNTQHLHALNPHQHGLRTTAGSQTLLSYNEMDYFEQFLGTVSPADLHKPVDGMHLGASMGDGVPMSSIAMHSNGDNGKSITTTTTASLKNILGHDLSGSILSCGGTGSYRLCHSQTSNASKSILDADTKRAHHIASEHKRRGRIRSELMRLNDLVPCLRGSSRNSQSKILSGAADFMEVVMTENERLRGQVAELRAIIPSE